MRTIVSAAPRLVAALMAATATALVPAAAQQQDMRECHLTDTAAIPLPDAAGLWYRRVGMVQEYAASPSGPEWRQVGPYGQGRATRPLDHENAGLAIASGIAPINGEIGLLSIGMSNTFQEFGRFRSRANSDSAVAPAVTVINAAQGGQPLDAWDEVSDPAWQNAISRVQQEGLTVDQVQVAWIKHAVRSPMFPPLTFPEHPEIVADILADVVRSLKATFPNVKLCYLSSRTRAYNTNQNLQSPEPAAYENGFVTQWVIERQLNGDPDLRFDGTSPPAPWLSWGPYLWIDGTGAPQGMPPSYHDARSDGAVWVCDDLQNDGVHPSPPTPGPGPPEGEHKVGDQLMAFFMTDNTTTPWFLRSTTGGPTLTSLTANGADVLGGAIVAGVAPFTVNLSVAATGSISGISWTYDDGTFSYNDAGNSSGMPYFDDNAAPVKVFRVPGTYDVRVAVRSGASGSTTVFTFPVTVSAPGGLGTPFCFGSACPCGNDSATSGCINSTGDGALLSASGSASVAADDLVLTATDSPPNNTGLFFVGGAILPAAAVGDGLACTGGLWRYAPGQVDASGAMSLTTPVAGAFAGAITAGDTRHFQSWTRDVLCGPPPAPCPSPCAGGSNLSNGQTIQFSP